MAHVDVLPVRTVGQLTRGASGNPRHLPLPTISTSGLHPKNQQADGTDLEGRGVQPDILSSTRATATPPRPAGSTRCSPLTHSQTL
jgi:hypothetical protein